MTTARRISVFFLLVACKNDYDVSGGPVNVDPGEVTPCGFTPISGTKVSRYDCNPVFTGTDEDWGKNVGSVGYRAELVMGHPFYQMWYVGYPTAAADGEYGLGYAISADGVNWELHPENPLFQEPENGGWDRSRMDAVQVVYDPADDQYVLAYQGLWLDGGKTGLGLYTSADGVAWAPFNDGEMVLDFGATTNYDGVGYCWPLAFTYNSKGFDGYLAGGPNNGTGNDVCGIYGFGGSDLEGMKLDSDPVLSAGPKWYDESGITSAAVVELDGTFYMFYTGFERWTINGQWKSATNANLNLATSSDGYTWEKHADNPIPVNSDGSTPGKGGAGSVQSVHAQAVGTRIHLWVTDFYPDVDDTAVGYFLFEPDIEPHP